MTNPDVHTEGLIARTLEEKTAKLPSDLFLWAAVGSIIAALILKVTDRHHDSNFVGHWAPTFLLLGIYNKLVKQHGSDRWDKTSEQLSGSDPDILSSTEYSFAPTAGRRPANDITPYL